MIWLYLYRLVVLLVSGISHGAALWGILWFGQIFARDNGVLTGDYIYTPVDLAVMAAALQLIVFLVIISPLGSFFQKTCLPVRRMSKREAEVLEPLLDQVMFSYKEKTSSRIKRVKLRIEDNTDSNAYAFGKNNIVLTSGFFREYQYRSDAIKGVMAHELGHLHHHDLWFWRYVAASGGVLKLIHAVLTLASVITTKASDIFVAFLVISLPVMIAQFVFGAFVYILRVPERALDMAGVFLSQAQEYRADKFAADIIGVEGMISFLESVKKGECFTEIGFLSMKRRSHPPSELRLEQLYDHPEYEVLVKKRSVIDRQKKIQKKKRSMRRRENWCRYEDNNYIPL